MITLARILLIVLIVLCSAGCGKQTPAIVPAPVVIRTQHCPRPAQPILPRLSGISFLESWEAYSVLKLRDSRVRSYIKSLEAALDCYDAQATQETNR